MVAPLWHQDCFFPGAVILAVCPGTPWSQHVFDVWWRFCSTKWQVSCLFSSLSLLGFYVVVCFFFQKAVISSSILSLSLGKKPPTNNMQLCNTIALFFFFFNLKKRSKKEHKQLMIRDNKWKKIKRKVKCECWELKSLSRGPERGTQRGTPLPAGCLGLLAI